MPQLDPTWFASQLFWLAISFVALYTVLSRFVLPPLQDVLARRKNTIESDIDRAQRMKSEADRARQEYERTLAEARGKSQQLINDAMTAQKLKAEQAGKDMDKQIAAKLKEAERMIDAKKEELIKALTPTATELATMIVEKLTHSSPGKDQVSNAISQIKLKAS